MIAESGQPCSPDINIDKPYIDGPRLLGSGISQLKCLQYDRAREFPDYKKKQYICRSPYKQLTWSIYVYFIYNKQYYINTETAQ